MSTFPDKPLDPIWKGGMTPEQVENWSHAYVWAYTSIVAALRRVDANGKDYKDWFDADSGDPNGREGRMKTVVNSLTSMATRMSTKPIVIRKSTDPAKCKRQSIYEKLFEQRDAYVEILGGPNPGEKAISLCPKAFDVEHMRVFYQDSEEWVRAFILVHEMHHAAVDTYDTATTADSYYSLFSCALLPISDPALAVKNAQNYAYFVMGSNWIRPTPQPGWLPDYGIWSDQTVGSGWGRAADSPAALATNHTQNLVMVAYREPAEQDGRLMYRILQIKDGQEVWLDPMPFSFIGPDGQPRDGKSLAPPALAASGQEFYCAFIDQESRKLVFASTNAADAMRTGNWSELHWVGRTGGPEEIAPNPFHPSEIELDSPSAGIVAYRSDDAPGRQVNQSEGLYCVYLDTQSSLRCSVRPGKSMVAGSWEDLPFDLLRKGTGTPTLAVWNGQLKCAYRDNNSKKIVMLSYEPVLGDSQSAEWKAGTWKEDNELLPPPPLDTAEIALSSWNTSNGKFLVAIGNKSELSDASLHFSLFSEKGTWLKGVRMSTMVSPNHPALVGCGSNLYLFYRSADGTIHSRVARDHDRLLWTLPATNNKEGQWKALSLTPELQPVTGIEVRVQDNYGVIDARVLYDGGESSNWTTNNTDQTRVFQCQREKDPITKVVVKEQSGYGVIDLKFTTRSGYESKWLVGNSATGNHTLLEITDQCVMVGLQGKEQGTRGLIDLRLAKKIVA